MFLPRSRFQFPGFYPKNQLLPNYLEVKYLFCSFILVKTFILWKTVQKNKKKCQIFLIFCQIFIKSTKTDKKTAPDVLFHPSGTVITVSNYSKRLLINAKIGDSFSSSDTSCGFISSSVTQTIQISETSSKDFFSSDSFS